MDQQEYEAERAALAREVPELLNDIRQYALLARLEGDQAAVERAEAIADFVEEVFAEILQPFAPIISEN